MRRGINSGSALLLTVMIIGVLTATTLGTIATRLDQLLATSQINDSAVAKLAADSGLAKLREKLAGSGVTGAVGYDLSDSTHTEKSLTSTLDFRPNPRASAFTLEAAATNLPRCLAVAVLSPWLNTGTYLYGSNGNNNPAMIFQFANIVNNTLVGIVPNNASLPAADKQLPISQLTGMGQFYNPFAPAGTTPDQVNYWTVKVGGPDDQFLTRNGADGSSSYYRGLDILYAPYLPRFTDSGLFSGSSFVRKTASEIQTMFQDRITANNFKVWLDASVTEDVLYQNGFADLFADDSPNRIRWLQPALWNDTSEASALGPYTTDDLNSTGAVTWSKQDLPRYTSGSSSAGWSMGILKAARPLGFIKFGSGSSQNFTQNNKVTGSYYGSLEGVRLQQPITVQLLGTNRSPLELCNRGGAEQGFFYDARVSSVTNGGGTVSLQLASNPSGTYLTPQKKNNGSCSPGSTVTSADIDMAVLLPTPQYQLSTRYSNAVDVTNSTTITPTNNQGCTASAPSFTACPAVGDLINLSKSGSTPMWGKVASVSYNATGNQISGLTVDSLRTGPKPVQFPATVTYPDKADSTPRVAVYGGAISSNYYDGGMNNELDELWIYTPATKSWEYIVPAGSPPSRAAGSSLAYDGKNSRLVVFGGYYSENVDVYNSPSKCGEASTYPTDCVYANWPGFRVAKRLSNSLTSYDLTTKTWTAQTLTPKVGIDKGDTFRMRVLATLGDRSGSESQPWRQITAAVSGGITLNVTGSENTVTMHKSPAGLSKGDELFITTTVVGGSTALAFRAKVTEVNFGANTVKFKVVGYSAAAATVQVGRLYMQVINRMSANSTCTGNGDAAGIIACIATDDTGFAVGDLVVLESLNGSNDITKTRYGYLTDIDVTNPYAFYFMQSETGATLKDFSVTGTGQAALDARRNKNDGVVDLPEPRYGAALLPSTSASPPAEAVLWQGGQKSVTTTARPAAAWHLDFAVTPYTWTFQNLPNPTASGSFALQTISYPTTHTIATTGSGNPVILPGDNPDPPPAKIWNDSTEYALAIRTDIDPQALGRVTPGDKILMERRTTAGGLETFHGLVKEVFGLGTSIKVTHDPGYPNDNGLAGDSNNASLVLTHSLRTDISLTTATATAANELTLTISGSDLTQVPPVGATIYAQQTGGGSAAFTATIQQRTYASVSGNHQFVLTANHSRLIASPLSQVYGANYVDISTSKAYAVSPARYVNLDGNGWPGAVEWLMDTSGKNPSYSWGIRYPDSSTKFGSLKELPAPRVGAATATIYNTAPKSTQIYMYGGTRGQYATGWRQNGENAGTPAKWELIKASALAASDLPATSGGALAAYVVGGKTEGFYFGGKIRTDNATVFSQGAYVLGLPDVRDGDGSFFLPNSTASANMGFFYDTYNNYGSSNPASLKNSFNMTSGQAGSYTVCPYLADSSCSSNGAQQERHLGLLGRMSSAASSWGGSSWGKTAVVTNPGDAFKKTGSNPHLLISGPALSLGRTNNRWDQNSYNPYQCDTNDPGCLNLSQFGTLGASNNYASDKSLMIAGYSKISQGGSVLVTTSGVGSAIVSGRPGQNASPNRAYSYCTTTDTTNYECDVDNDKYLSWLPDPEDLLFTMNAAKMMAAQETYRIVGYYGNVRRGYLVVANNNQVIRVQEIAP